jgi:hypothetical protein
MRGGADLEGRGFCGNGCLQLNGVASVFSVIGRLSKIRRIYFDGFTKVAPAREIPVVWKAAALDGFDGLDEADVFAVEENTFAIGFVDDGKAGSIGVEARITLNE